MKNENFLADSEQMRSTFHYYLGTINRSGRIIYNLILAVVVISFISLPLVKIDISIRTRGIIRPASEKTTIYSLLPGLVDSIYSTEGSFITSGDTLITLDRSKIQSEIEYNKNQFRQISNQIHDLQSLLSKDKTSMISLKYKLEYENYHTNLYRIREKLDKARKEKERVSGLFNKGLISEKEYDDLVYNESLLMREYEYFISNSFNQWQSDLADFEYQLNRIRVDMNRLEEELEYCIIKSPVTGTINYLSGIYQGSYIQAGEQLVILSPDTVLLGELYVAPDGIGLIYPGQEVVMVIDAFEYSEWGTVGGEITDVSNDFLWIDDKPMFRIRCNLTKGYVSLNDGRKGMLKKGMTFNAICKIKKRTLLQLLLGRMNKYLNPNADQTNNEPGEGKP